MEGKLRALGRLLNSAGDKLMHAVPSADVDSVCDSTGVLRACAVALQDLAGAIMNGQADTISEQLAALQGLLTAPSPAQPLPREALNALSKALEGYAEGLKEACACLATQTEDALFDAAGMLRAAARLFSVAHPAARTLDPMREITSQVAQAPKEDRRSLLRTLAQQYHPDRHPGREMEVLPVFLHVQGLRKELQHWAE